MKKHINIEDRWEKDELPKITTPNKEEKKIVYVEPKEYFPKEIRKKYKLGEYAENSNKKIVIDDEDLMFGYKSSDLSKETKNSLKGNKISNKNK